MDPHSYNRHSIRLIGYDYSKSGLYFITICTYHRKHLFGRICNGTMILNKLGQTVYDCWFEIPQHYPQVILGEFVVMPNHIHGIIIIDAVTVGAQYLAPMLISSPEPDIPYKSFPDTIHVCPASPSGGGVSRQVLVGARWAQDIAPLRAPSQTIGAIIRGFKIGVTKWSRGNTDIHNVWQRNYYEHIIRDGEAYQRIVEYIRNNPKRWNKDCFNEM